MNFYLSPESLRREAELHLMDLANKGTRWFHFRRSPKAEYKTPQVIRLMVQFASKVLEDARAFRPTHRHRKGGLYQVIYPRAILEEDLTEVVVYKASDGTIWVRRQEVFNDGRFTPTG